MRIERPDWADLLPVRLGNETKEPGFLIGLNTWYDNFVYPLNEILGKGFPVYQYNENALLNFEGKPEALRWSREIHKVCTHKALLINITELKPETSKELVKEMLDYCANRKGLNPCFEIDWSQRAEKVLTREQI